MFDIKARLHDPGSAEFEHSSSSVISRQGDRIVVTRPVRAKNAFGALVRQQWQCEYRKANNKLQLISVKPL
jgi:hypothetical protein